jgi:catechol 2,3-dioxygenase-like lactoylglutathione lyase family enzyme
MIVGLSHACFVVTDLQRSLDFYRDRLGLPVAFEFRSPEGKLTGVYLHVGARTFIELFQGKLEPAAQNASYKHICLEVDDIESTIAELTGRGVKVTDKKLGGDHSWQAWLSDPDGNRIELHGFTPQSQQVEALERLMGR